MSHLPEDARVMRRQLYYADGRVNFGTGRRNLERKSKHKVMQKRYKLDSFHQFASHSKVAHSDDHFSEEGLFGSRFSKSSFKFTGKSKVQAHFN